MNKNISRRSLLGLFALAPVAAALPRLAHANKKIPMASTWGKFQRGLTSSIFAVDEGPFQHLGEPTPMGPAWTFTPREKKHEVIYAAPDGDPLQWGETPQTATTLEDAVKMAAIMAKLKPDLNVTIHLAEGEYRAPNNVRLPLGTTADGIVWRSSERPGKLMVDRL